MVNYKYRKYHNRTDKAVIMTEWRIFAIEVADGQERKVADRLGSRAKELKVPISGLLVKSGIDIYILVEAKERREVIRTIKGVKGVKHLLGGRKGKVLTDAYTSSGRRLKEYRTDPEDHYVEVSSDE